MKSIESRLNRMEQRAGERKQESHQSLMLMARLLDAMVARCPILDDMPLVGACDTDHRTHWEIVADCALLRRDFDGYETAQRHLKPYHDQERRECPNLIDRLNRLARQPEAWQEHREAAIRAARARVAAERGVGKDAAQGN